MSAGKFRVDSGKAAEAPRGAWQHNSATFAPVSWPDLNMANFHTVSPVGGDRAGPRSPIRKYDNCTCNGSRLALPAKRRRNWGHRKVMRITAWRRMIGATLGGASRRVQHHVQPNPHQTQVGIAGPGGLSAARAGHHLKLALRRT